MIQLSPQDVSRIAEIVRQETGNQVQEKNYSMIEARMRSYMDRFHFTSMSEYWAHFEENERAERDAIAGLMTTHYTFFFREYLHFEILENWLKTESPRLLKRYQENGRPVQVWSAACSRGQEVYSLAMFLEYHLNPLGIPFQILGSDIDQESVNYAKNGVYPLKEVNSIPMHYLSKHVRKGTGDIKEFAAIHPELKKKTQFRVVNLMDIPADIKNETFDVIFCRNVFIYFSEDKVSRIAQSLATRLVPDGLFFSGISEPLRFGDWKLASFGPSVYQKGSAQKPPTIGKVEAPTTGTPASNSVPVQAQSLAYRVLCVDDSPTIQKLMTNIFQKDTNCRGVVIANNGREAADILNREKFDLITLDIHMPEVNGIEFLEKFYQKDSHPPVIMVSSVNRSDLDLATKALSLGAFDYVEKPSMNQIEKSANEILSKTKLAVKANVAKPKAQSAQVNTAPAVASAETLSFDRQIGKKLVVPDASRCLRIVNWRSGVTSEIEQVIRAQKAEYRSPALIVIVAGEREARQLVELIPRWSDRPVDDLTKITTGSLRPNRIYVATPEAAAKMIAPGTQTQVSLQILNSDVSGLKSLLPLTGIQILLSENLKDRRSEIERGLGQRLSDITPATSFASLSVEYFAMLRTAAA